MLVKVLVPEEKVVSFKHKFLTWNNLNKAPKNQKKEKEIMDVNKSILSVINKYT